MHKDDQKLNMWMMVAAIACCGIPLLILVGGGLALALGASFSTNNTFDTSLQANVAGVKVGDIAPDFSFQTVEGQEVTLSSLKGEPVLFAFALATGCAACIIEAENVREAQTQIPFKVIQLSINPYETPEDLLLFRKRFGNSDWLIGFDKDESISKQYQVKAVDTTLLVDAQGKIIYRDDGFPAETKDLVDVLKKSQK